MPQPAHDALVDPDAERGLLSALQASPPLAWQIAPTLRAEMFGAPDRAQIYTILVAAAQADRPLPHLTDDPPASDPLAAAKRIRDLAALRVMDQQLTKLGQQLNRAGAGDVDAAAVLTAFEAAASAARSVHNAGAGAALTSTTDELAAIVADVRTRAERYAATGRAVMGIETGYRTLDDRLNGLEPGLIVLGGQPGAGKTTFANLIAANVAERGTPVLYVTFENSRANLILKHLCRISGTREIDARRGLANPDRLAEAAVAFGQRAGALYYIDGAVDTTVDTIRGRALQIRRRHDAPPLIVVDYLQKMAHGEGYDELRGNVSALSARLRDLSRDLAAPVLALASLNRAGYGDDGKTPKMVHLKESGDIEYGADAVLLLSDAQADGPPPGDGKAIMLTIAKNRGGESGGTIPLVFKPSTGDFREQATPFTVVGANGRQR